MIPRGAALFLLCLFTTACPLQTGDGGADAGGSDAGSSDAGRDGGIDAGRPGPYASCAEGGLTECFSNHDCAGAEVCLNVGADPDMVPCCVTGTRGALGAGEVCDPPTGETDCESSLCIEGTAGARCTDVCVANTDCPTGMQNCTFIAFSGSNDQWCLFE